MFIDKGEPRVVASVQNEILKSLIEKCLGHAKPAIKSKGMECFLSCFEATEMFEESFDSIIEMLNSKNQKVTILTTNISRSVKRLCRLSPPCSALMALRRFS